MKGVQSKTASVNLLDHLIYYFDETRWSRRFVDAV
jgi:hypothetical protein